MADKVLGKGIRALIPERLETEDEDVRKVLRMLDNLLEKLPDDAVKEFANSEDFRLYEKVLRKYGI
ncbi:MAG: hypothetical protein V1921_04210 [Candidatus Altiarchaeota archaeon]